MMLRFCPGASLWRSLTSWLGGMGILLLMLTVLPSLGVVGLQIYKAELPGPTADKLVPRLADTVKILYLVYGGMTLLQTILLLFGGLSLYDSLLFAFATVSTGVCPLQYEPGSFQRQQLCDYHHVCMDDSIGSQLRLVL